jgi:hypothetical protein
MLPPDLAARQAVYDRIITAGSSLHAALENRCVSDVRSCAELEETIAVAQVLGATPFGGRYEKDGLPPAVRTATEAALLRLAGA